MAAVQEKECGTGGYTRDWQREMQERDLDSKEALRFAVGACAFIVTICFVIGTYMFCRHAINKTRNDSAHVEMMREQARQQTRIGDLLLERNIHDRIPKVMTEWRKGIGIYKHASFKVPIITPTDCTRPENWGFNGCPTPR